jgi:hypothetical protein
MPWIDRIEKIGRVVLWLSLASACVIAPVEYMRQHRTEAESREAARKADEAEKAEKAVHEPHRLAFASMGMFMSVLVPNSSGDQGKLWLTNVSSRTGILCVRGQATNRATQRTAVSLPRCENIGAYASATVSLMFAGGELSDVCPKQGDCGLTIHDAPEAADEPVAAK